MKQSFDIFKKISPQEREQYNLQIDAIYKSSNYNKNLADEVLSKLFGVGNLGGFRYKGPINSPEFIILTTSGEDIYWKDELDATTGILIYYGDNKSPGLDLHSTDKHGNEILRNIFLMSYSDDFSIRKKIPPIFVFKKHIGRDMQYLGLAVPGIKGRPKKDWLTAIWGCNKNNERFQNYKAIFTIIDPSSGSDYQKKSSINLAWLNDINKGLTYESKYAPYEWKKYIDSKNFKPLYAKPQKIVSSKEEQLPIFNSLQAKMLQKIHDYFIGKDNGYSFEKFSVDISMGMDTSIVDLIQTRPYKDGGFDAVGKYKVFKNVENIIYIDFYLQAKCYSPFNNAVTVKDTSRLISRIKDKQFGIMFTTSYIANQAYSEVLEDNQPIVFVTGKNIVDYIFYELEIKTIKDLECWLKENY